LKFVLSIVAIGLLAAAPAIAAEHADMAPAKHAAAKHHARHRHHHHAHHMNAASDGSGDTHNPTPQVVPNGPTH
jgi:hypothetical protein